MTVGNAGTQDSALSTQYSVQMPESFDIQGPEYAIETGKELLPLFAQYGLKSAVAATLEKVFTSWIRNPSQELWDKIKAELTALEGTADKRK
jgi:hypothetical protein